MTLRDRKNNLQQRRDFAELMKHYPFTAETLVGEIWRDIEGYDGKYQISNYARVKSFKYKQPRILKPYLNEDCYLMFNLSLSGRPKFCKAHRLVAKAFIPNTDNKPQVNHIDGIKWNSVLTNLEWATNGENSQHAYDTGLKVMPKGENVHNAKFTNEQVVYIRNNPNNLTQGQLAEMFNVHQGTISGIQLGQTYTNVAGKIHIKHEKQFRTLSPELHEEIYRLYQTGEYTHKQLAEMFGTVHSGIYHIIHQLDKKIGRKINYQLKIHEPSIREQIRAEYVKGSKEFGSVALAKKYGCSIELIRRIIHEGIEGYKPKEKPPRVPDDIRKEICTAHKPGDANYGTKALAKKYGVAPSTIRNILRENNIHPIPPLISDDVQEEIRRLYVKNSTEFGSIALAKKYNCSYQTILRIISRGGADYKPREQKKYLIPEEIREQIRAEYAKGTSEHGAVALAKKYGCSKSTIFKIVHAGDAEYKPRKKAPKVPDEIRKQIRAEYVKNSREFGSVALGKKYGVDHKTIIKIVHEK